MRPFVGACSERVNFKPQRLLAGTEGKVYLEDCESRRRLIFLTEKTWFCLAVIPVLVSMQEFILWIDYLSSTKDFLLLSPFDMGLRALIDTYISPV